MSDTFSHTNPFPELTAESLESAAESRFPTANSGEQEGTEPGAGEPQAQIPQDDSGSATPEFTLPDSFEFDGRQVTRSEVEAWSKFDRLLREDAGLANTVFNYLRGNNQVPNGTGTGLAGGGTASTPPAPVSTPPAPTSPTNGGWGTPPPTQGVQSPLTSVPDGVDLDDPTTRFLWNTIQSQQQLINNFQGEISRHGSIISSRVESDAKSVYDVAVNDFKSKYGLDDSAISAISSTAARLEVVPSILRGIDPITGGPTDPNPLNAVTRALEAAAFIMPEYRQHMFAAQIQQNQLDDSRKAKLTALSGGGGRGVPRTPPAPRTPAEARQAMLEEVSAAMFGNGTGN